MACETRSLAECSTFIVDNRGRTCPVASDGMPLIATNCLRSGSLYPTYETERYVSPETYSTWFRAHPKPGDIIFVTKGSPGRVCLAPDPVDFCIAQDMVAIRANEDIVYPRYLFALLRSKAVQDAIVDMHVGTLIPHFKKGDFDKLQLPILSKSDQRIIGDLYFDLSHRIELLARTNTTLEAIAQALFKSWFVDFDPVRAKAEGREPEGMDAATAALFPSEIEDSELGPIPKGWHVEEIGRVVSCVGGATPSTKNESFWEGGAHHWATPKDLSGLQAPVLTTTERLITDAGVARISSGLLPAGTLLMSSRAPIGYLAIASVRTAINQGFIAMLPGGELPASYLLFWARTNMESIKQKANGSTFMEISKAAFRPIKVCVPTPDVVKAFSAIVESLIKRIELNERHKLALTEARDTLLPRLISGKLRLPEAEEQLGAAA